ncbi:MAG: uroporphyrinogen decarboxylase (URO-D) [Clostridiales bacterium]|nr:uroporphyrinogen decarboxylase (URO-D) [Clostridiales bacterium]
MGSTENLKKMLQGIKPDGLVVDWEPFKIIWDPLLFTIAPARPGATVVDPFGVTLVWDASQPGPMPLEDDAHLVCKDITHWKETIKAPDVANMSFDWGPALGQIAGAHAEGKLALGFMPIGNFELMHNLMGFEEALVNLMIYPDEMHELLDYLTDYRMACFKQYVENMHPDIMLMHDDWGSKERMLMSPEIWREFFKPSYQRMYGYLRENGIYVMHHADSYLEPIVRDMEEIGINIWQGTLPQNDIVKLQKEIKGSMIFMGGLDAGAIDRSDVGEDFIRGEVRRACETYVPGGNFIPSITYGGPGSIFPGIDNIIQDEIRKFESTYFK